RTMVDPARPAEDSPMGSRLLAAAATALACAGPAAASQLIDRSATNVQLGVNGKGEALVTYVADGRQRRVLAWGAVNALPPTALQRSHWSGPLAKLQVWSDWVYRGRFQQLFGRLTYRGRAVHGFGTTRYGAPTDHYGRLLYLDTYDSGYGSGWRRENSFVAHK